MLPRAVMPHMKAYSENDQKWDHGTGPRSGHILGLYTSLILPLCAIINDMNLVRADVLTISRKEANVS